MENEKKYLPEEVYSYEQLLQIFRDFHIDSEKTRFFIGSEYTDPKAFVIFQNDFDDYLVYKVKADGTRALRYKGKDEAYAVNEYYQKFLEEVRKRPEFARKLLKPGNRIVSRSSSYSKSSRPVLIAVITVALTMILSFSVILVSSAIHHIRHRHDGYYSTPFGHYYYYGKDVYYYDDDLYDWLYYGNYDTFDDFYGYDDYTYSEDYYYNDDYSDFRDSDYYDLDSDDDDDSGWDDSDSWDSWDSGGSDWDSDW